MGIPVTRRATWTEQPVLGYDALDVYDALVRTWRDRCDGVPVTERTFGRRSSTPFFVREDGTAWTTADSQALAQEYGAKIGIAAADLGGKAFRIAGATDLRLSAGDGSQRTIRQRGRWGSDVAEVYQRALVGEHLDASFAMGAASHSRDMEELCEGWCQSVALR